MDTFLTGHFLVWKEGRYTKLEGMTRYPIPSSTYNVHVYTPKNVAHFTMQAHLSGIAILILKCTTHIMSTNTGVVCIALNALLLDNNNSELFSAEVAVTFLQNSSSASKTNAENSLVCFLSLLNPVLGVSQLSHIA